MQSSTGMTPPLSPVLFAGFLFRPIPAVLLQPPLDAALYAIQKRHPDLFERLAGFGNPVYLIDPVDLPYAFLLKPEPRAARLLVVRDTAGQEADAVIRGPFLSLLKLLEGNIDGDSLFFSRELVIEGDTEAVVALRNAVDGAEIDIINDLLAALGPLAKPAGKAAALAGRVFKRAASDLSAVRDAMIAPALQRGEANGSALQELESRVERLSRRGRPVKHPSGPDQGEPT
ncbi:MAG: SCP2 sterol-binding domain-containing protein [Rhodospirillales bacterium]|nr:SCP2 sterol-binding domain-containing protein [Rhodospirillales bacterium]